MLDIIIYPLLFLFIWVCSFLVHELMHIVGTGSLHGTITIDGFSMSASPACLWSGGILSGLIFTVAGGLVWIITTPAFGYLFIICGLTNIIYGWYEAKYLPIYGNNQQYKNGRYSIYISTISLMILLWVLFMW